MRNIPEKIDSKFRFVLLVSQRAEQMMRGAQPKVEQPGGKPTRVAMNEIMQEAVEWDYGAAPEEGADEAADGAPGEGGPGGDVAAAEGTATES